MLNVPQDEKVSAEACDLVIALLNPSERKRLDAGPAYEGPRIEAHQLGQNASLGGTAAGGAAKAVTPRSYIMCV